MILIQTVAGIPVAVALAINKKDKSMQKNIICLDLDGTVSDGRSRLHYIKNPPKDWHNFFMEGQHDPIYPEIVRMVKEDADKGDIIVVTTARPITYYDISKSWLDQHNIPYNLILMRRKGDHRPDYVVKEEMIDEIVSLLGRKPNKAYDDKDEVIDMFRNNGLEVIDAKTHNDME